MRQAHYDSDQTRWHMRRIPGHVLHSPRLEKKIHLSSSVLQCANQNVKSITLQAGGKSRQMKFSTRTASGPWWVLVSPAGDTWRGGSDSSLTGEGTLVLGLQLTVMIRRDRCLSVWTRKTMSNGAFDVIYFLLSHIPDYFNGKLGNKLFFMLGHTLRLCLYCIINVFIMYVVMHFIFLEIIVTIIPLILYCNPRGFVCFCVNLQISGSAVKSYKLKKFNK